nr:hypothetical protein [Saliphagus sp. LR7]
MSENDGIEYELISVEEVLQEMKDIAELLIDLSYSSVLFENTELAEEYLLSKTRWTSSNYRLE